MFYYNRNKSLHDFPPCYSRSDSFCVITANFSTKKEKFNICWSSMAGREACCRWVHCGGCQYVHNIEVCVCLLYLEDSQVANI